MFLKLNKEEEDKVLILPPKTKSDWNLKLNPVWFLIGTAFRTADKMSVSYRCWYILKKTDQIFVLKIWPLR